MVKFFGDGTEHMDENNIDYYENIEVPGEQYQPVAPISTPRAAGDGSCPSCGDIHCTYLAAYKDAQGNVWDDFQCDTCGQIYCSESDIPFL